MTSSRLVFIACSLFLSVTCASAQNMDPASSSGLPPTDTYQHTAYDSVDLLTLQVSVHIPLLNVPQKGSLKLGYSLIWPGSALHYGQLAYWGGAAYWVYDGGGPRISRNDVWQLDEASYGSLPSYGYYTATDEMYTEHDLYEDASHPDYYRSVDGSGLSLYSPDFASPYPYSGSADSFFTPTGVSSIYAPSPNPSLTQPSLVQQDALRNGTVTVTQYNSVYTPTPANGYTQVTDSLGRTFNEPQNLVDPASPTVRCPNLQIPNQPLVGSETWTVPGPNGQPSIYLICYAAFTASTDFFGGSYSGYGISYSEAGVGPQVLQSIVLPDNSAWTYSYESASGGMISRIGLPAGGSISYTYINTSNTVTAASFFCPVGRRLYQRTIDPGSGQPPTTWTYSYDPQQNSSFTNGNRNTTGIRTIVSGPYDIAVHFTLPSQIQDGYDCNSVEDDRQTFDGPAGPPGSRVPLEETATTYQYEPSLTLRMLHPSSILPSTKSLYRNGIFTSKTAYTYDSGLPITMWTCTANSNGYGGSCSPGSVPGNRQISLGMIADPKITNGSATLNEKATHYLWQDSSSYLAANLLMLPTKQEVIDPAAGNDAALTLYGYDETPITGGACTVCGTQTSVSVFDSGRGGFDRTTRTYNEAGVPATEIDANGNITQVNSFQCGGLFPQSTTVAFGSPVAETTVQQRDCVTGAITSSTDPNGIVTTYQHNDPLGRVTQVGSASGTPAESHTTYVYASPNKTQVLQDEKTAGDGVVQSATVTDGLGRTIQQVLPNGATIETQYDFSGNVASVTNPHSAASAQTDGTTTYAYDALGRMTLQCNSDNGNNFPCQPGSSYKHWVYNGKAVSVSDEAGNTSTQTKDALERLVQVVEPNGASTSYGYDSLGNLKSADQSGLPGETPRTRTFSYDSVSRLLTSTNPETGLICYGTMSAQGCVGGYDANGNLLYKTDARGLTTSYSYDALNRLILKSAPGITNAYGYDGLDERGNPVWGATHAVGRLSHVSNEVDATDYGYDWMGHQLYQNDCFAGTCNQTYASYDLAGHRIDLLYPDGVSYTRNAWDAAGRLNASAAGQPAIYNLRTGQQFLQSIIYNPDGSPGTTILGNGVTQTVAENPRLQVASMSIQDPLAGLAGATFLSHTYCYVNCPTGGIANNGNLWQITDNLNGSRTQAFTYDPLNRISSYSQGGVLQQQYAIDSFGNIGPSAGADYGPLFNASNQVSGWQQLRATSNPAPPPPLYDAAGNQTGDTDANGLPRTLVFDAEGRLTQIGATGGAASVVFTYGADGSRNRKQNYVGAPGPGTISTQYFYFEGEPIAERDQAGAWTDYIYANGKRIAMVQGTKPAIHLQGVQTQGAYGVCGTPWYVGGQPGTVLPYTVKPRDLLSFDHKAVNALSGLWLGFGAGTYGGGTYSGDVTDTSPDGNWHHSSTDLSSFAGQVATALVVGPGNPNTPVGSYDAWIANVTIASSDGTVHPLFTGGTATGSVWGTCGNTGLSLTVDPTPTDTVTAATFYASDHLGSAQMEFSASGTPLSLSQFMPFGQEINPPVTANHYKFTGKERDSESGLDYFGARYYGSNMGRWMSPDPSGLAYADPTNPQSLNLYSYVLNNPLSFVDPDGLECVWDDGSFDSADDKQTGSHGGCSAQGGTYVDPKAFSTLGAGDWSSQANSGIASVASTLSGDNNFTNVTVNANGSGYTDQTYMNMSNNVPYMLTNDSSHGPDPIIQLATQVTADSNHYIGCIAAAEGVGGGGTAAYQSGQPTNPKPFAAEGAMPSSSPASEFLSGAANKLNVPRGRYPSPVGGPGTGMPLGMRTTPNAGRAAARWLPVLGLAADAYAAAQLWNCLGH